MKTLILAAAALVVSVNAMADVNSCMDLVHERTMAPVSEMAEVGNAGYYTVVRSKPNGDKTYYQCDGMGNYRQKFDFGWSVWRTGDEWNATHWMQW